MTGKINTSSPRQHHNSFQPSVDISQSPPVCAPSPQICWGLPQDWHTKLSSEIPWAPPEWSPSSFWVELEEKQHSLSSTLNMQEPSARVSYRAQSLGSSDLLYGPWDVWERTKDEYAFKSWKACVLRALHFPALNHLVSNLVSVSELQCNECLKMSCLLGSTYTLAFYFQSRVQGIPAIWSTISSTLNMNQETQRPKKPSKLYRNAPFIGPWLAQKFKGMKNTVSFWVKAPRKTTKTGEVRG